MKQPVGRSGFVALTPPHPIQKHLPTSLAAVLALAFLATIVRGTALLIGGAHKPMHALLAASALRMNVHAQGQCGHGRWCEGDDGVAGGAERRSAGGAAVAAGENGVRGGLGLYQGGLVHWHHGQAAAP